MQFQVPQFIDVSPKIVGPLTLKQFLYLAGAAGPSVMLFFILNFWIWILITAFLAVLAVALAFIKFNGRPLPAMLMAAFVYFWNPRLYLWRRVEKPLKLPALPKIPAPQPLARAPLKDLGFKLATTTRPIEKREKESGVFAALRMPEEGLEIFRRTTGEREAARRVDYR